MSGAARRRIVLVTGLSGAGKSLILRTLEDLGYQSVDNLPLALLAGITAAERGPLAIGIDARARDFHAGCLLASLDRLRADPATEAELVFATARPDVLLRRYTETRRRHPLAPVGRVSDGVTAEALLLDPLRRAADWVLDTSALPAPALRSLIEARFRLGEAAAALAVNFVSFAFPVGLPCEADLVFDARFLRNPHYIAELRPLTGRDAAVRAFIEADPNHAAFFDKLVDLLQFLLPRFLQEGKRYVTVAIGCTGGRHRSVHMVESLAPALANAGWRVTRTHRELIEDTTMPVPDAPPATPMNQTADPPSVRRQEA